MSALAAGAGGDKQSERVRGLFHRQLQVPLEQGPATMAAYTEWTAGCDVSRILARLIVECAVNVLTQQPRAHSRPCNAC